MARIIKGKYYPHSNPIKAKVGYKPSHIWRGITHARERNNGGCLWRIGKGQRVDIGEDK